MSNRIQRKSAKLKSTSLATRLARKAATGEVSFGKPKTSYEVKHSAEQLSAIWENAQSMVVKGKLATLSLSAIAQLLSRFSSAEINELVIPKRTSARRKVMHESLTPEETDKTLRLARISAEADRVFGDPNKSGRWLRKSNVVLSGQTPLELLKTETGAIAVGELLGQIDHGMVI